MATESARRLAGATVAALALAIAGGAQATTVLSDNFDAETTALNYVGFANWTVSDGTVDLVDHNTFSINCFGGGGKCVDLDGSTSNAGIMTTASYAFDAGDLVTLRFQARGNDRGGAADTLFAGFTFDGVIDITNFFGGGFAPGGGVLNDVTGFQASDSLNWDDDYALYTLGFTAAQAGSLRVFINTTGGDNVGPILDNVTLDVGVIPEPTTWAVMLLGFGAMGAMLRRRRTIYA